jgi:hypothetical protein
MKTYHLSVNGITEQGTEGAYLASAYGDLDTMAYVARKANKAMEGIEGGQFSVNLVEVENILGDETRTIVETRGDAEVCAYVLNKRIRSERTPATTAE